MAGALLNVVAIIEEPIELKISHKTLVHMRLITKNKAQVYFFHFVTLNNGHYYDYRSNKRPVNNTKTTTCLIYLVNTS